MSTSNPPPIQPNVYTVPHERLVVQLHRCSVKDVNFLADFCDGILGRDFFFKRRHLQSIIERETNQVFAVAVGGGMAGLVICYKGTVLDNLYISPEHRETGVGSAILQYLRPQRIRSKTNMLAGDPTPFYQKNGYVKDQPDPERPHIVDMVLPAAESIAADAPHPASGQAGPGEPHQQALPADRRAGDGPGSQLPHIGSVTGIVPSPPPVGPAALPPGYRLVSEEEWKRLDKLRATRERVKRYREKRRAEQAEVEQSGSGGMLDIFTRETLTLANGRA